MLQFKFNLNCINMSKKHKKVYVIFQKRNEILKQIDIKSLELFRQMMSERFNKFDEEK